MHVEQENQHIDAAGYPTETRLLVARVLPIVRCAGGFFADVCVLMELELVLLV
jgi:hypothetical protein